MSKKLLAAVLALGILPAAPSQADIIFGQTSVDTDCNVTFNGPGDISGPETTVSGTCGDAVVFFRASEDLVTPGGGQARVEAEDGRFLRIQFELGDDLVSQTAEFNIQIAQDTAGTFVVTIDSFQLVGGVLVPETFTSDPFTLGTGENRTFAMAVAGTNEFIDVVTIMGNFTAGTGFTDIRQVRLGDVSELPDGDGGGGGVVPIPEPLALGFLGAGILGAAYAVRRRRQHA